MTNLTDRPKQSNYEAVLASPITASQTTGITLSPAPSYASGGETTQFTILNPKGVEHITATGWSTSTGILTGVTRGVVSYTGGSSTARAHGAGTKVVLGNPWQLYDDINTALDSKVDVAGDTMTGRLEFSGTDATVNVPTFADTTARDAAITSPSDGDMCTLAGDLQHYNGTTAQWETVDTGTPTPNASTTVAGKVEIATQAEVDAGTDTGGTGATLSPTPSQLNPNNLTNAKTSLADNDVFVMADSADSDAIKKIVASNLGFVKKATLTAKGDIYAASAASTPERLAVGTDDYALVADSGETTGLKWADIALKTNLGQGTRSSATGTGTVDVAHGLGKTPKAIMIHAQHTGTGGPFSQGYVDDDRNSACTYYRTSTGEAGANDASNCVYVRNGNDGYSATISAWDDTNFTISWTVIGSGLNMVFTWIAIS